MIQLLVCVAFNQALFLYASSPEVDLLQQDIKNRAAIKHPAVDFVVPQWEVIKTVERWGRTTISYAYVKSANTGFVIQMVRNPIDQKFVLLLIDYKVTEDWKYPDIKSRILASSRQRDISISLAEALFSKWAALLLHVNYGFDHQATGVPYPVQLVSCTTMTTGLMTAVTYEDLPSTEADQFRKLGDALRRYLEQEPSFNETEILDMLQKENPKAAPIAEKKPQ